MAIEGMDAALKNLWGFTALQLASMLGLDELLSLFLGHLSYEDVYEQDEQEEATLHKSAY